MKDKLFRIALGWAIALLLLISTAPGCLLVCNQSESTTLKEKPIEQIQAHPFRKYANRK
jgi:hypothetical protein